MRDGLSLKFIRGSLRNDRDSGLLRSLAEYAEMFGGHDAELAHAFSEVRKVVGES